MADFPEILTAEQVCEYLQISMTTCRKLTKEGTIPATKLGRQWRYDRDQLREFVSRQGESSPAAAPEPAPEPAAPKPKAKRTPKQGQLV